MSDFTSASTEYEFVFKAVLHVLVYAYMELAAIVIERPGTELVYVTVVILQDLFHGPGVTGAGRLDHCKGCLLYTSIRQFLQLPFQFFKPLVNGWCILRHNNLLSHVVTCLLYTS